MDVESRAIFAEERRACAKWNMKMLGMGRRRARRIARAIIREFKALGPRPPIFEACKGCEAFEDGACEGGTYRSSCWDAERRE